MNKLLPIAPWPAAAVLGVACALALAASFRPAAEPPAAAAPSAPMALTGTPDAGDERPEPAAKPTTADWAQYTIQPGDRLSRLWQQQWELPLGTLYSLLAEPEAARHLNRIRPGHRLQWQQDADDQLTTLRLWTSRAQGLEWLRTDSGFELRQLEQERQLRRLRLSGELQGNLAAALAAMPELAPHAGALATALDQHLPLRQQARDGDRFTLLVEQEWLDDDDTPYNSRLLAIDYRGQRLAVEALRHSDNRFYTPEGRSLLPPFDRYPFEGRYRISSGFDLQRRHPITRRVQPHHGTDFATPVGTPITAPADGRVVRSGRNAYAGRYLVIAHDQGYTTRYLHLHRLLVSDGERVSRGQRIALSGNTGRTTGAHLHYELHIDGRPVDPMRAPLPAAADLAGAELQRFQQLSAPLLASLRNEDQRLLAVSGDAADGGGLGTN